MQPRRALTPRESQVLELIASGLQDKQIAAKLNISINTVRHHVQNAIIKHGAQNRCHLIALWLGWPVRET